ncbi:hypothetical protein F4808DRAFT_424669 [Astrocystis sublimbata]|nr:hypothetical protein F4808DRAFT_424669 [Astrocystis sublimbata]
MEDDEFVSPLKTAPKTQLDHLIISITDRGDNTAHALNEFRSEQGRQSTVRNPGDYDYALFREELFKSLKVDPDVTLYPSNAGLVNTHIRDQNSFRRCLTQIQRQVPIAQSKTYRLPTLELSTRPNDDNVPDTPTRVKPPKKEVVPDLDEDIMENDQAGHNVLEDAVLDPDITDEDWESVRHLENFHASR